MKWIVVFLIFVLIIPVYSQQKKSITEIQAIVQKIQLKYAPDKRTAIFNITPRQNGKEIRLIGETSLESAKKKLVEKLTNDGYTVNDNINLLPSKELGDKIYGILNVSVANLRTEPKHSAEMATQALLGSKLKIMKKSKDWYLVQTPDKYIAWIESESLIRLNNEELSAWDEAEKVIFIKQYGFSHTAAKPGSLPVSDLVIGDILKKISSDGQYAKLEYPDGRIGFVSNNDVMNYNKWVNSRNLTAANIINTAKSFMGIPYLWGGTSAKALDCSGFTKTVFFLNGILLPRDASQQVNVGISVNSGKNFENFKTGDLLFFGTKANGSRKEKVTHVGIYIGNGEFIHESGSVRINSFDKTKKKYSAYRYNQFLRAKRIINSAGKNGVVLLSESQY